MIPTSKLTRLLLLGTALLIMIGLVNRSGTQAQTVAGGNAGARPFAVLLCQYQGNANTYGFTPSSVLASWMSRTILLSNGTTVDDSIGGLIQDASLGLVTVQGTQAFGWFTLPKPASAYTQGTDAGDDCIAAAQAGGVNLSSYSNAAVYLNGALPDAVGVSWHAALPSTAAQDAKLNASVVGVVGLTSPPLMLHELGHVFGSDKHTSSSTDPLGLGAGLGDDPSLGIIPGLTQLRVANVSPEWDASRRELFGFIPAASIGTFSGTSQTYNLSRLTKPIPNVLTAIDVPLPDGSKYVVSARTRTGYDALTKLDGFLLNSFTVTEGVRIELVTDAPGSTVPASDAQLMMSNPSGDPNGTDAVWLGCQSFADSANGLRITIVSFNPGGSQFTAQILVSASGTPGQAPAAPTTAGCTPPPPVLTPLNTFPPFTDNLADATAIPTPVSYGNLLNNGGLTTEAGEPLACNATPGAPGAVAGTTGWLQFSPTTSGPLTVSTNSSMPVLLAVYSGPSTGASLGNLVQVGCSTANLVTKLTSASVPFTAVAGQTYYVQLGGIGTATGNFDLAIQ